MRTFSIFLKIGKIVENAYILKDCAMIFVTGAIKQSRAYNR